MKKILFPTDFSDAANHAFIYALQVAKKLGAQIITLHVYQLPDIKALHLPVTLKEVYDSLKVEVFENYRDEVPFLRKIAEENGYGDVPMTHSLEEGESIPGILKAAQSTGADMIVMGTKGAGWLKEIFIGSVAGEVLENAPCPVLAVPIEATFDGTINKIAVTTDFTEEDCKTLNKVLEWAQQFDAVVYCVHVDTSHTEGIVRNMEKFKEKMGITHGIEYVVLNEFDLEKSISQFIESHQIDILAMLTHKRSFFEELFNYSHAKAMSYHTNIPILSIQAHTLK